VFNFFKPKEPPDPAQSDINEVSEFLERLGYKLLPEGEGVVSVGIAGEQTHAEVASFIALYTLAREIRNAGDDIELLALQTVHAHEMLKLIKRYRGSDMIRKEPWEVLSTLIFKVSQVDSEQEGWLNQVLNTELAKLKLAERLSQ